MMIARPQAGETLNFVESTTSTNGWCSASASVVDRCDSRRSGAGSVVTALATPPTSSRVGVWAVGAGAPMAAVVPGSSAVTSALPIASRDASGAVTVEVPQRRAPGSRRVAT